MADECTCGCNAHTADGDDVGNRAAEQGAPDAERRIEELERRVKELERSAA